MGASRVPGPVRTYGVCRVDGGTSARADMPTPTAVGRVESVARMSLEDRFREVLFLTKDKLPGEMQEEFLKLLAPQSLAMMVVVLAAWAGSHYIGIGFIADAVMLVGGLALLGWQIFTAADDFVKFIDTTYSARTRADLDTAANHLAEFIAVVGVAIFMLLLAKGVKGARGAAAARAKSWIATAKDAGMPTRHFGVFRKVSQDTNKIILVRQTNPKSVRWIEKGYPGKPKELEPFKTSASQHGLTRAKPGTNEIENAANIIHKDSGKKFYVVDRNRRTATDGDGNTIDLSDAEWPLEHGQIISPASQKPFPGDYDLMGVVNPSNTGQNLALVSSNKKMLSNFTNTVVDEVSRLVNRGIGEKRVLHGPEEAYGNWDRIKPDDVIVAFFPDGRTTALNRSALIELYEQLGRRLLDMKGALVNPAESQGYPGWHLDI